MDYEVDFAILEAAASRAGSVAKAAARPLSQMRIDGVGQALPGGVSGGVADRLDRAWVEAAEDISKGLDFYAEAMTSTAANYRAAEAAATEAASAFFGAGS